MSFKFNIEKKLKPSEVNQRQFWTRQSMPLTYLKPGVPVHISSHVFFQYRLLRVTPNLIINVIYIINIEKKLKPAEVNQRQFWTRQSMPLTYLKSTSAYLLALFINIGFYA